MEYDIKSLPIDDVAALLNFYYDYQESRTYPTQVKEYAQKKAFNYYLNGKQYLFYSEDAVKMVENLIVGKNEAKGMVGRMKDKIVKREEHEREILDFIIRELHRNLNEFFNDRIYF